MIRYFVGEKTAYLSNGVVERQFRDKEIVDIIKELIKRDLQEHLKFFLEMGYVIDTGIAKFKSTATLEVEIKTSDGLYLAKPSLYPKICTCIRDYIMKKDVSSRLMAIINEIRTEEIVLDIFIDLENRGLIKILENNDIVVYGKLHTYLLEFSSGMTYIFDGERKGRPLCIVAGQPLYRINEKTQIFLAKTLFLLNDSENKKKDRIFARQIR